MICSSPSGFVGGDRVHVSITFNGMDYSTDNENTVFTYFSIKSTFPHSGPSNAHDEVILIHGAGFKPSSTVMCSLNRTEVPAVEITPELIKCPMSYASKDPKETGAVKFGMEMDGAWTDFGQFTYYEQVDLFEVMPNYGPNIGNGIVYLYGSKFRNDFANPELACKIGDSIGQGELIETNTIRCIVDEMDLVNEGESLPVMVSLNSYSWVGGKSEERRMLGNKMSSSLTYTPYGVLSVTPESGPFGGFTDILVTGKGFTKDLAAKMKCRFGVDEDYAITDAEVLDYTKLVCRSPAELKALAGSGDLLSIPFNIGANEEEFKPWTKDLHRYRFYTAPVVDHADPDEVKIGKMAEIYLFAEAGSTFVQPVPTKDGGSGVSCSFGELGTSMGMWVNSTCVVCMSPHFQGTPEDYYRVTVTVGVALNGQDFNELTSNAEVTFLGTGADRTFLYFIVGALLLALLLLALGVLLMACLDARRSVGGKQLLQQNTVSLKNSEGSVQKSYSWG